MGIRTRIRTKWNAVTNWLSVPRNLTIVTIALIWGTMPLIYALWRGLLLVLPGHQEAASWDQWFYRNVLVLGAFDWIYLLSASALSIGAVYLLRRKNRPKPVYRYYDEPKEADKPKVPDFPPKKLAVLFALVLIGSFVMSLHAFIVNDKDLGRYYASSTVFYVPDISHVPPSVSLLMDGAVDGNGDKCDKFSGGDVPTCIKQATLSDAGWDPRVSSLDGAKKGMQRSVGQKQGVSVAEDTMTYLNTWTDRDGKATPARWSGIMDGSSIQVPMAGVAEWSGSGYAAKCVFEGDYAIDRALSGDKRNDLPDKIKETYPDLRWNQSDAWGYCDGNEPIVIIPATKQEPWKGRTVDASAGFIKVQGDHGKTKLTLETTAKPGQYPGPVYPISLVAEQRDQIKWAGGRQNMDRNSFGYEPSDSPIQGSNVSEYVLRDAATGRLQYVTPLTLRNSASQLFIAFAVTNADEVTVGKLNQMSIYVLAENDPRITNLENMNNLAVSYLSQKNPGFFTSGDPHGALIEFIPVKGKVWRVFGEQSNRVQYLMDVTDVQGSRPVLVDLDADPNQNPDAAKPVGQPAGMPAPASGLSLCGNSPDTMSIDQLKGCLSTFIDELAGRASAPK